MPTMSSVIGTVNLWIVGRPLNLQEDGRSLKELRGFEFVKLADGERRSYLLLFVANFLFSCSAASCCETL